MRYGLRSSGVVTASVWVALASVPAAEAQGTSLPSGQRGGARTGRVPDGQRWVLAFDGGSGFDTNPQFASANAQGDVTHRVEATLGHMARVGRSRWQVVGRGENVRLQTSRELDRVAYDVSAEGLLPVTPRLNAKLTGAYRLSWTPDVTLGGLGTDGALPTGVGLPLLTLARSRNVFAGSSVAYRFSPKLSTSLSASAARTQFDAPGLVGGDAVAVAVVTIRQYGPASTVGAVYDVQRTALDSGRTDVHTVSGTWTRPLGRASLALRFAASAVDREGVRGTTLREGGDVSLRWPAGGTGALVLRGARSVSQTLGIGALLFNDQVGVEYDRFRPDGAGVRFSAQQAWSSVADGDSPSFALTAVHAEVRRAIGGGVAVGVGVLARRRAQAASRVEGVGLTLGLARTLLW